MPPTHITVTAAEGRLVPLHSGTAVGPGRSHKQVEPGEVVRVPYDSFVRRRVAAGDLVLCNTDGVAVTTPEDAAYPDDRYQADLIAEAEAEQNETKRKAREAAQAAESAQPAPVEHRSFDMQLRELYTGDAGNDGGK